MRKRKLDFFEGKDDGGADLRLTLDSTKQVEKLELIEAALGDLYKLINGQELYDFDKLAEQLETIAGKLDLSESLKSIETILGQEKPSEPLDIKGFAELLKTIRDSKPKDVEIDFGSVEKAIIAVGAQIEANSVQDQTANGFTPMRRVVKVGRQLLFDDNPTPARGGGGGSSQTVEDLLLSLTNGTATATDTVDTSIIAAPGATFRIYVTDIIISNTSATNTEVNIKDGSTTKLVYPAPSHSGAVHPLRRPLQLSLNAALKFASADAVTSMKVSAIGYISS